MVKRIASILVLLVVVATVSVNIEAASIDPQSPLIPLEMRILPNGLRVIVKEIPSYPVTAVNIWVGAGSKHDPEGLSGLAHFFEHLLFKGTATRPTGQISWEVESVGGYLNAGTSLDFTTYYIVVPSNHFAKAMEIQADAIRNSAFRQEDIDQERTVIHEEIRISSDTPNSALTKSTISELFRGTQYARPVLGSEEDLANVNRPEMVDFHSKYYVPNNMTLVVTGQVDAEEVFELAQSLYGSMEPRLIANQPHVPLPSLEKIVQLSEEKPVDQSYLLMAHPAPSLITREAAALTMAGIILGGGRASRLYRRLVEDEELVNSVSASYNGFADMGLFMVSAHLREENVKKVEAALTEEFTRLQEEPVSDEELQRAQAMARSNMAFSAESNANLAMLLGQYETFGGIQAGVNRISVLESITAQDILLVARNYLDPQSYVLNQINPLGR